MTYSFCKSWYSPILQNFHGVDPEPKKDFLRHKFPGTSLFYTFNQALHVILNRSDVESFFLALDQLHGRFSGIGAHQDLQKPNFVMPELLIQELCSEQMDLDLINR